MADRRTTRTGHEISYLRDVDELDIRPTWRRRSSSPIPASPFNQTSLWVVVNCEFPDFSGPVAYAEENNGYKRFMRTQGEDLTTYAIPKQTLRTKSGRLIVKSPNEVRTKRLHKTEQGAFYYHQVLSEEVGV